MRRRWDRKVASTREAEREAALGYKPDRRSVNKRLTKDEARHGGELPSCRSCGAGGTTPVDRPAPPLPVA